MKKNSVMTNRFTPLLTKSQRNGHSKLLIVTSCTSSDSLPETISYWPLTAVPFVNPLIKRSPIIALSSVPSCSSCDRWTLRLTSLNQLKHIDRMRFGSTRSATVASSPATPVAVVVYTIRSTIASRAAAYTTLPTDSRSTTRIQLTNSSNDQNDNRNVWSRTLYFSPRWSSVSVRNCREEEQKQK